jgi:hypothetical protein
MQVSTSIYDDLASCGAVLSVLTSILEEGKVKAPASFELRFKDLAQLQHQRDDQDGLDTIMSYLYSAGYVRADGKGNMGMPGPPWSPSVPYLLVSALTWHASDPSHLVPPNAIERELTLNKARKHHFTRSIVPLMWNAPAADDAPSWERRMERQLERLGTQRELIERREREREGSRKDTHSTIIILYSPVPFQCMALKPTLSPTCAA